MHSLPVLAALRRHLPEARLGWLVESAFAPLLENHPDLDDLLVVRLRRWRNEPFSRRTWVELFRFLQELDRFGAELVLDLMGNHKAGILGALTMADRRIGFERKFRREPSSAMWMSDTLPPQGTHSVDRMLSLLDAIGLPAEPANFEAEKILPEARAIATDLHQTDTGPRVSILPGAGRANKRYPPARWGEVARLLAQDPGNKSWVVAGPGEEGLAAEVVSAARGDAEALLAPGLDSLAAVLRRAELVLGGDTGPLHLAHALGRPVVCLMGPTDPERSGPYGALDRVLWKQLPCSSCHEKLEETKGCLHELSPEEIVSRARALLG